MKKLIIQNLRITLFCFALLFVLGLVIFYKNLGWETVEWTSLFSAIISLFLIICMGIYQFIYIKSNKISLSDFNIQATQESTFTVNESEKDTANTIQNVLPLKINAYKFKYNDKLHFFKTKTGATIRSFGETIIIKLTKIDNTHTQLYVLSKPVYKTTLIDFGKSSVNIEKIKQAFN